MEKIQKEREYVKIVSLKDIQPPTMNLLGLKFIDEMGNRYTVKKNLKTEVLEVRRLLSKSEKEKLDSLNSSQSIDMSMEEEEFLRSVEEKDEIKEELQVKKEEPKKEKAENINIAQNNLTEESPTDETKEKVLDLEDEDLNLNEIKSSKVVKDDIDVYKIGNDNEVIQEVLEEFGKQKERIQYIIINLIKSKIYELNKNDADKYMLNDFKRDFEYDVMHKIEKTTSFYKELLYYPREYIHYTVHYKKEKIGILNGLSSNQEKIKYILKWEMQKSCEETCDAISKSLATLLSIINVKTEIDEKLLNNTQKVMFSDAKESANYCLKNINLILNKINEWKNRAL